MYIYSTPQHATAATLSLAAESLDTSVQPHVSEVSHATAATLSLDGIQPHVSEASRSDAAGATASVPSHEKEKTGVTSGPVTRVDDVPDAALLGAPSVH